MDKLVESLMEELNCNTVFTIPLFGGIPVLESVVVTWIIMAIHDDRFADPGERPEDEKHREEAGSSGKRFYVSLPFLWGSSRRRRKSVYSVSDHGDALYCDREHDRASGFKSPTKDLNVTASLAVMSIVLVEAAGIRKRGIKGWLKSFAEPIPIIAPINVLELFIRPLSLCMRLFGNVLGAVVVMALIKYLLPVVVPLPFSGYFDIFDGVIQAYVFVFLTSLYIKEAVE